MQAVCVIIIEKIKKMSEKELKLEKQAKLVVSIPVIILVVTMLFLTSCSSTRGGCGVGNAWPAAKNCPAYR